MVGSPLLCVLFVCAGDGGGPFDRFPYLQSLSADSVLIVAQTKEPVRAELRYGPDPGTEFHMEEAEPGHDHVFVLEDLAPETRYYYGVTPFHDAGASPSSFRTLPLPGRSLSVAVFGDSGSGENGGPVEAQQAVADVLNELDPHLVLHTGDLATPLGVPALQQMLFFEVYRDLLSRSCVFPTVGNHTCNEPVAVEAFRRAFHLPEGGRDLAYSFDAGDAHFVALDSCGVAISTEQIQWLEADLARTDRVWRIVYFHHPPYGFQTHAGESRAELRETIAPVMDRFGVDLVLSGHEHRFEQSYPIAAGAVRDAGHHPHYESPEGTIYVVSGGGGASAPYPCPEDCGVSYCARCLPEHHVLTLSITPDRITAKVLGKAGRRLHCFTITKGDPGRAITFLRGDCNESGSVSITDAVVLLTHLFQKPLAICHAACDINQSGNLSIADPLHLLAYLFSQGPPPPAPFPACGVDDTADLTGCCGCP